MDRVDEEIDPEIELKLGLFVQHCKYIHKLDSVALIEMVE